MNPNQTLRNLPGSARLLFLACLLLSLSIGVEEVRAQDWVDTTIEKGTLFKIQILVRDFTYEGTDRSVLPTGEQCESILVQDLEFSDYFDVQREGVRSFGRPAGLSTEAVVWGRVLKRWGKVVLDGQLIDSESGELIFQKDYPLGDPPERWAIHAFSDDVVLYLTGERGVASTRIAFVGDATGSKEIYLVDYDGARLTRVTSLNSITISPAWSPDGGSLAFTSFTRGNPDLYSIDLSNSKLSTVSSRPGINSAPCWHPAGNHLLASLSYEGNAEIYKLERTGKVNGRLTFQASIETAPTYSPAGNQIAFVSDRVGQTQIYVMDGDGANVRRLTYVDAMCESPDWAPGGDRILFVARFDSVYDVCTIRADGSDPRRLTAGGGNHENPKWAPDGRHIVFAQRNDGSRHLYVMAADGSGKRRLTWSRGDQYNPAWSPSLK